MEPAAPTFMVDVTIAIVNWNTCALLRECLASIPSGTSGVAVKVVVVDNGSSDGSAEMVRASYPQAVLVSNRENVGFARGNNQAHALAEGRYLLLLNPDAVLRPGAVTVLRGFLDAHPAIAGATGRLLYPDGTFQRYYKRLPTWGFVLATHTVVHNLFPGNRWTRRFYMADESFDRVMDVEQPPAACLMLRRAVLPARAVFDERFPIFFNDIDLCRVLRDGDHRLAYVPSAEIVHHGSGGGVGQMKDEAIIDYLIGLVRYVRKHEGAGAAALLWTVLSLNSLGVLLGGLLKALSGRREPAALGHEFRRRLRLARMRERFQYPSGVTPTLLSRRLIDERSA